MEGSEPKPRRVEVEVSSYTDDYETTWLALHDAERVLDLASTALKASGIVLVPTWRGHYMHEPEVTELLSEDGRPNDAPSAGWQRRVTVAEAAQASMAARVDELDTIVAFVDQTIGRWGNPLAAARVAQWASRRQREIKNMAARPPEGDERK